jgi:DUF2971 family protein
MLPDRHHTAAAHEIIFHYCNPAAFFGLTQSKKLWFSDVFAMNDFLEMHWGYSMFEAAASSLLKTISKPFFDRVDDHIRATSAHILPLASCFSQDGDVLSQWRAYAADGSGFAIGFSAVELSKMPIKPLKVLYDKEQQIHEVKTVLLALHEVEQTEGFTYGKDFRRTCGLLPQ